MSSPTKSPGIEAALQDVADQIQRLNVTYRRFFAGALETPPDTDREAIVRALRDLRNVNQKTPVERFRLANLEAQFNSYSEMFQRRLRDLEEGSQRLERGAGVAGEDSGFDVEDGIVFDGAPNPRAVDALYEGLASRGSRVELETFRSYLDKQMAGIRKKTGCAAVQFRLVSEGGKVKLKAKAMGAKRLPSTD